MLRILPCLALALVLAACSRPEPPDTERPPEPQAEPAEAAAPDAQATQLRDAMQAPIEKAQAVEDTVQDAAQRQREAIEAAGG